MEDTVEVIMHDGSRWRVGSPIPGDGDPTTGDAVATSTMMVVRIFLVDGVAEVFVKPSANSQFSTAQRAVAFHFTLMPLSIKSAIHVAPLADWKEIQDAYARRVEEDLQVLIEGEEPDEPDEPETVATPSAMPPQAAAPRAVPAGAPLPVGMPQQSAMPSAILPPTE